MLFYYSNNVILLAKKHRLIGKEVIFLTRKRQYISHGFFGFFYVKQYPNIKYNQFSCHITIKLSKKAVVRHMFKRAIVHYIERHTLVKQPLYDTFYKFFIVLSKDRIPEIEQKIANFDKKDTIKYIQDEFEKSWEGFKDKIYKQKA